MYSFFKRDVSLAIDTEETIVAGPSSSYSSSFSPPQASTPNTSQVDGGAPANQEEVDPPVPVEPSKF